MSGACDGCTCAKADSAIEVDSPRTFTGPTEWKSIWEGVDSSVPLRSKAWWNKPDDDMCGEYIERYMNSGLTVGEISQKDRPIIGIAQTGSDLSPCNQHHLQLVKRIRDGIISNGGTPLEFPCHPIQENTKRPTASLDRNLAYLSLTEVLFGYPLDGVVLLTGCDKTTPALLMAASTINIPAIAMNVGPMLNGYAGRRLVGSGQVLWDSRLQLAQGKITQRELVQNVALSAPSAGHCNTMGTASTMNALAEALGMALPGSASIPAVYRERGACAYQTGRRIVDMVREDLKPSDIMTRGAFENAIACCTAIGGSTNAPIHINAIAKHIGVDLDNDDWDKIGYELPLLVNVQPAGEFLCEEYHRAGGLPAVISELLEAKKLPDPNAVTVTGKSIHDNCLGDSSQDKRVIMPYKAPLKSNAGFIHLSGNLFDSAVMKTSVISPSFRARYLSNPLDPEAFEGPVVLFDGPEDYHSRINTVTGITDRTILIMRGTGPQGYPGAAEVVNMLPPGTLAKRGVELPCIGDGRQSGTCGSPCILNASPEAASGGMLGYLKDGDVVRIDLARRSANVLVSDPDLAARKADLGLYKNIPKPQTPWQEIFRKEVGELSEGMVLRGAVKFQDVAHTMGIPRRNH